MWDFKYFLTSDKKTSIAEKMSLLTNKLCVTRFNQYIYNQKDYIDDAFWKYLLTFLLKKKLKKVQKLWCFLMIDFVSCARILYQFVVTKAYSRSKLFFQNLFAPDQSILFVSSINTSCTTKNQNGEERHEIYFFNPILKIIRKFSQYLVSSALPKNV